MLKPLEINPNQFGIGVFDEKGNHIAMAAAFQGTYYKTEERANKAIDRLNKKMGW
jgi:hypothetical protein